MNEVKETISFTSIVRDKQMMYITGYCYLTPLNAVFIEIELSMN